MSATDRRLNQRFPIRRECRYKYLTDGAPAESGTAQTIDIASGGVSFTAARDLPIGAFIELSISWPALLDDSCPMRLHVFGRVIRSRRGTVACTVDKYEFRTQSRTLHVVSPADTRLQRWARTVA